MLSVANKPNMLNVIMLSVVMLNVVAPLYELIYEIKSDLFKTIEDRKKKFQKHRPF